MNLIFKDLQNPLRHFWILFLALAALFQLGYRLDLPLARIVLGNEIILSLFLVWMLWFFVKIKPSIDRLGFLMLGGVFLFFFLRGTYLEYASDQWENFRLIAQWQNKFHISEGYTYGRFLFDPPKYASLLFWTFLKHFSRENWRLGLNIISATTMTAMTFQLFLFSKNFAKNQTGQYLFVFGAFLFTGQCNLVEFLYRSLASNIISLILFYGMLSFVLEHRQKMNTRKMWVVLPWLLTIYWTHTQGLLMSLGVGFGLLLFSAFGDPGSGLGKWKHKLTIGAVVASIIALIFFYSDYMLNLKAAEFYEENLAGPGILFLLIGFFIRRKIPLLYWLSVSGVVIFLLPISNLVLFRIVPYPVVAHRMLWAVPIGFLGVASFLELFQNFRWKIFYAILAMLLLSVNSYQYWYGRLDHLLTPTSDAASLRIYDPMVLWMESNRGDKIETCRYATDQVTDFLMTTYFAWPLINSRIQDQGTEYTKKMRLALGGDSRYCGIIIRDGIENVDPESWIGERLHHWERRLAQPDPCTNTEMKQIASDAAANGWKKTQLPAGYFLLEPRQK